MPKVSVVIPVYNTERYLPECLGSITSQTLQDIEIICVNDGSEDGSAEILEESAARDERIVIIEQPNQGLSAARNTGVAAAKGDYVYFIDSDDYLEANALEELYGKAAENELDVFYFDATSFFEDSTVESENAGYKSYYDRSNSYPEVMTGPELLGEMANNGDYKPSPCLQLIRRAHYEAAGLSFYVGILHEDHLFSLQCALQAQRVKHVPRPFYHRRVRGDSIMTVEKGVANLRGFYISYLEMLRFAANKDYAEKTSSAIARLCTEVLDQAQKIFNDLPEHEREAVRQIDSHPDALITYTMLVRNRSRMRKAAELETDLTTRTKQLETHRNSRSYKAVRYLRRLFRFGR